MPPKRMTANPARPARYRPGKPVGPEVHESSDEEESEAEEFEEAEDGKSAKPAKVPAAIVSAALKKVDLNKRFEQSRKEEEARKAAEESSEEEEDDEEQGGKKAVHDSGEEESSSEYTSDSDDESQPEEPAPRRVLLRPTFIPKSKRNGTAVAPIATDPSVDEEVAAKKKAEEAERRKAEAEALVEEHLRQQAAERAAARRGVDDDHANDASLIDDTDDIDPAAERAAWKLRELLRIKRERDELEKVEKEREEIERRRNMDASERYAEDMEYVKKQRQEAKEAKGEMGFMQKYYHKGVFYQDDSDILKRNYATAAVEDQVQDKSILPKYMQVRGDDYGKRGKTKWTHLAAEDTSKLEGGSPWFDTKFSGKTMAKLGGMKDERFLPDRLKGQRADQANIDDQRRMGQSGTGFNRDREGAGRDHVVSKWSREGQRPPEGPKATFNVDRRRGGDRYQPDRSRTSRGRSRSLSRSRSRSRDRNRDRFHHRDRDRERDRDRNYARADDREWGRDGERDRRRDYDRRCERDDRDRDGERKRRPTDADAKDPIEKRRKIDTRGE